MIPTDSLSLQGHTQLHDLRKDARRDVPQGVMRQHKYSCGHQPNEYYSSTNLVHIKSRLSSQVIDTKLQLGREQHLSFNHELDRHKRVLVARNKPLVNRRVLLQHILYPPFCVTCVTYGETGAFSLCVTCVHVHFTNGWRHSTFLNVVKMKQQF